MKTGLSFLFRAARRGSRYAVMAGGGLILPVLLSGCGLLSGGESVGGAASVASEPAAGACLAAGQWFDGVTLEPVGAGEDLAGFHADLAGKQVVLLGESHDNPEHHAWQLQTLGILYGLHPDLVIGFEAFPRSVQPALDGWSRGEQSLEAFLLGTRWPEIWGFPSDLYAPLFSFARRNRLAMTGLNIDPALVRQVGEGGFQSLPEEIQAETGKPAPASEAYLASLEAVWRQHLMARAHGGIAGGIAARNRKPAEMPPEHGKKTSAENEDQRPAEGEHQMPPGHDQTMPSGHDRQMPSGHGHSMNIRDSESFRNFVQAQQLWDRAFAAAIAARLEEDPDRLLIGIIGSGHLEFGYGVRHQLADMGITDVAVLLPEDAPERGGCRDRESLEPGRSDAFFLLDPPEPVKRQHKLRLGVMIAPSEQGGVDIGGILPDGPGAKAGLRKGDRIIMAAGRPLEVPGDLVDLLDNMAPGTWLPVEIERNGRTRNLVVRFPAAKQAEKKE